MSTPCLPATPGRLPGTKVYMQSALDGLSSRPRIVIADEDPAMVQFVIQTLRKDGNAVFHAYDALSAVQLAFSLDRCDLLISNTRVEGLPGVELIHQLRSRLPNLPILYMANTGRSTPELEAQLPPGVPILREPFTAEELRAAVHPFVSDGRH
jgi:DNA-binding response OmpR family regulator